MYSNEKYQNRIFTDNFNKKKYQLTNNIELLKIIVEQRISWPLENSYSSEEDLVRGAVKRQIQKQFELMIKQLQEKITNLGEIIQSEKDKRDMWIELFGKEQQEHTKTRIKSENMSEVFLGKN